MRPLRHRLVLALAASSLALLALGVGCAAPAEEDAGDSTGAMTTGGAMFTQLQDGQYAEHMGEGDGKQARLSLESSWGTQHAVIRWAGAKDIDFGDLDITQSGTLGSNAETGPNGDGGTRCGFKIRYVDVSSVRVTSACGRGDLTLKLIK